MTRLIAVLAVFTLIAGCSDTDVRRTTGIKLSASTASSSVASSGIAAFCVAVLADPQTPVVCGAGGNGVCVPVVGAQGLPSTDGNVHAFAQHFFNLPAGAYTVIAVPEAVADCSVPITVCPTPISTLDGHCCTVPSELSIVNADEVTSVMLETDCSSPDTAAGLDLTAVINNKPIMGNNLSYNSYVCTSAPSGGGIEDVTTYTKKDDNNHLTVTATEILAVGVQGNEDVWVYKDFGANYFNELNINFEIQANANIWYMSPTLLGLENQIGGMNGRSSTDLTVLMGGDGGYPERAIHLMRGNYLVEQSWTGSIGVPYYLTLTRIAGNDMANLKIYSDSGRTILLSTLSVSGYGTTTKWRYLYGFQTPNNGDSSLRWYGYSKNIELLTSPTPFTVTFSATDPDNDVLTWTFSSTPPLPSGCTISGGILTCPAGSLTAGDYQVTVKACDPRNLCTQLTIPIHAMDCD